MNYIDITQPNQTLKVNLNYSGLFEDSDIGFSICKDGSDAEGEEFGCSIVDNSYYHTLTLPNSILETLEDETQYTIRALDYYNNDNVIYRGKFQTTSKDLNNLSVNEGQYIKKTTATNYTILD